MVLAGGVLLLAATVLAGARGDVTSSYALSYSLVSDSAALQPQSSTDATGTQTFVATFPVLGPNVTRIAAHVTIAGAGALPPTATLHATLRGPSGNETSVDATAAPGASSLDAVVSSVANVAPQNTTVRATSAADARARLIAPGELGAGTWTLTVRVSSGVPSVAPPTFTAERVVTRWSGTVSPGIDASR